MMINTAAVLSDKNGSQYNHGWTQDELDKLKALGLFKYMMLIESDKRVFLYDVDRTVNYDYINWIMAGGEYASLAGYTDDDHDMEEKLLVLKNKLETDGTACLDTFEELFGSELTTYLKYLDLVKTCTVLMLEDIERLHENPVDHHYITEEHLEVQRTI